MPYLWHHSPSPQEMGFYVCASSSTLLHERRSRLEEFSIFAYSHYRFHHWRACQGQDEIGFVVHGIAFSSSCLSFVAWPIHHSGSRIRDCLHESSFCQFEWCAHFPLETFHSLRFDHAQGWESYLVVGIQPVQADGSLLDEGLILPCLIVALTNTSSPYKRRQLQGLGLNTPSIR